MRHCLMSIIGCRSGSYTSLSAALTTSAIISEQVRAFSGAAPRASYSRVTYSNLARDASGPVIQPSALDLALLLVR